MEGIRGSTPGWGRLPAVFLLIAIIGGSGCSSYLATRDRPDWGAIRPPVSGNTARLLQNAHYYKLMGRPEAGLKEMEEAYLSNPDNLKLLDALARNYEELGKFDRAQKLYQEALARQGHNPALHNNLCFSYYQAGNWAKAEACFREALGRDPGNSMARNNLGMLLCRLGKIAEAQRLWQEAEGAAAAQSKVSQVLAALEGKGPVISGETTRSTVAAATPASPPAPQKDAAPPPRAQVAAAPAAPASSPAGVEKASSATLAAKSTPAPPPALPVKSDSTARPETPVQPKPVISGGTARPTVAAAKKPAASVNLASSAKAAAKKPQSRMPAKRQVVSTAAAPKVERQAPAVTTAATVVPLTAEELIATVIEIRNGTWTRNLAHQTRSLLFQEGFNVGIIGNHIDFGAQATVIYYRPGAEKVARALNSEIFPGAKLIPSSRLDKRVAIKVVLGYDLLEKPRIMARLAEE